VVLRERVGTVDRAAASVVEFSTLRV